jgi:hypothetical protein
LYAVALAVYLGLIVAAGLAYRVAGWSYRPDLETLKAATQKYREDEIRMWAANECVRSIEVNEPRLKRKAGWVTVALALLAVDATLLSVAALFTLSQ